MAYSYYFHNLICNEMKKALAIIAGLAFIVACGNNADTKDTKETTETQAEPTAPTPAADPEVERGLALVGKSDCFTCHKVVDKSTGPAYEAVAAKYPDDQAVIDSLAHKVIKGGVGNWGTVPMTPHPDLSEEDAKAMVKYVLSLK
jgi:cytochrome c